MNPQLRDPLDVLRPHAKSSRHLSLMTGIHLTYLFGGTTSFEAREQLAEVGADIRINDLHRSVRHNGVLLRDVKVLAYALFMRSRLERARSVAFSARTGLIDSSPVDVYPTVLTAVRGYAPLRERLEFAADKTGNLLLSVREVDDIIGKCLLCQDVTSYTRKFVYRKMAFIMRSSNVPFYQIHADLLESAVFNLLRTYPYWVDGGHVKAIAKTAIRNRGQNFIKESTTASRRELITNADGSCSAVSMHMNPEVAASVIGMDAPAASIDGSVTPQEVLDIRTSVQQLVDNPRFSRRQQLFLKLMRGDHHSGFSSWLGVDSNSELAFDGDFDEYFKNVVTYLEVEPRVASGFLSTLREHL